MNNEIKIIWKNILIGGTAAGIVSIIPIINILNLFLMLWMGCGGALAVYLTMRENNYRKPKTSEALLTGALSGVWGCTILGVFVYIALTRISPEKFAKAASLLQAFFPNIREEFAHLFQDNNLQSLFLMIFALLMVLSIISGAAGGIISKSMSYKEEDE